MKTGGLRDAIDRGGKGLSCLSFGASRKGA